MRRCRSHGIVVVALVLVIDALQAVPTPLVLAGDPSYGS
jgi:hypothetical protein